MQNAEKVLEQIGTILAERDSARRERDELLGQLNELALAVQEEPEYQAGQTIVGIARGVLGRLRGQRDEAIALANGLRDQLEMALKTLAEANYKIASRDGALKCLEEKLSRTAAPNPPPVEPTEADRDALTDADDADWAQTQLAIQRNGSE
jgi:hypothetical protein